MKYALIGLQYLPYVLAGVNSVESTLQGASGQTKKAAILSAVSAATAVGSTVPEDHVKVISALIDSLVAALNTTGFFASKATAK